MASSAQKLQFICRNCRKSLIRSTQTRAFSSSHSRSNIIPSFQETSSPELDAIFLDWRRRVFTPAALSTTHRALVYKKSRHQILENDPGVTVTMSDGEDVKLEPMYSFDKPNTRESLRQIASLLGSTKESDAWSQLPAFLEGMQLAQQKVPVAFLEKITRKANEQGKASAIVQCAAMVKKTGVSLAIQPVTRELYLGCHERFVAARSSGEEFEKEQKFAERLAVMLESKDHCGGALQTAKGQVDMRRDLTVMGVLLELVAAKAISVHQGKDVDGLTGNLCQKLIAVSGGDILRRAEKTSPRSAVEDWIPIAHGIRLALQVNGLVVGKGRNAETELKNALQGKLNELDTAIKAESDKVKAEAKGKSRRALAMLENVQRTS